MLFEPQPPALFLGLETLLWNQPLCSRQAETDTKAYCSDSWQACQASGTQQNGSTVRSSNHQRLTHCAEARSLVLGGERRQRRSQAHSVGLTVDSRPCWCRGQKRQSKLQATDQKGVASKVQCLVAWKTPNPSASSRESSNKKNLKEHCVQFSTLNMCLRLSQNLLVNSK